jgi:alanine racemase
MGQNRMAHIMADVKTNQLKGIVTWAEVDLDAIAYNIHSFKKHVGDETDIFGVVKANAYGHGAVPVSKCMIESGVRRLVVHRAIEGRDLRKGGITVPIVIMGYTPADGAQLIIENQLTPTIIDINSARALSGIAEAAGVTVNVHIEVDSGMNRQGLYPDVVPEFVRKVRSLPGLFVEGLYTHFATSDWADLSFVHQQVKRFSDVLSVLRESGINIPIIHAANSAAAMRLHDTCFNAIRPGIAVYGLKPSDEVPPQFEIRRALSLKSLVSRVFTISAGEGISYGRSYIAPSSMPAALVPVGYGDGYHRILSNRGQVLIHGRRAPVVGRICMDQFVAATDAIPDVNLDDEVVLIGRQGEDEITAEEVAGWAETINYEVTTSLLPRVPRVYLRDGSIVETSEP